MTMPARSVRARTCLALALLGAACQPVVALPSAPPPTFDAPPTPTPNLTLAPTPTFAPTQTAASEPVVTLAPTARLVDGRSVFLETDVSETDRYGRLLRYVWLRDGGTWLLVNLELVRLGLAQVSTYPPDVKYTEMYLYAQREARNAGRGLWGDPPEVDEPDDADGCDSAYPDVCIPPSPPDLDCGDILFRRFKVIPPDPHRFDGDHDGIGCESG